MPRMKLHIPYRVLAIVVMFGGALSLAGCGASFQTLQSSPVTSSLPAISGKVHGGAQPIVGADIQLYAANTSMAKGASNPLLSTPVITGPGGTFSISAGYSCSDANSIVYLVATGGNPGLANNATNQFISLMAVLGTCGTLSSVTQVTVNELTTVATVQAFAPFMADFSHIGSSASNPSGLAGAFATASSLVDFGTGTLKPPANGITAPTQLLNTLADILAACVNSPGGVAGSSSACGTLFFNATNGASTTADTASAMLYIAQFPAQNVPQLYSLASTGSPFQPYLITTPTDFTASTNISIPASSESLTKYMIAIDTAQDVWVYTPIDSSNTSTGSITVYSNSGNLLFTIPAGTGGLYAPLQLAPDAFGNMWVLNNNSSLSKFDPVGNPLSPSNGFVWSGAPYQDPENGIDGLCVIANCANQIGPSHAITVDPSGNVWGVGSGYASSVAYALCYAEISSGGTSVLYDPSYVVTAFPPNGTGTCPGVGYTITSPGAISLGLANIVSDESGNLYMVENEMGTGANAQSATPIIKISNSGMVLSPSDGYASIVPGSDSPLNVAYDRNNDELWIYGASGIYAMHANGTSVSPSSGFTLPSSFSHSGNMAIDGAGNAWFTNFGSNNLYELSPAGAILSPNSNPLKSGYYPSGASYPSSIAVDANGNIWLANTFGHTLTKMAGLAVPKTYQ